MKYLTASAGGAQRAAVRLVVVRLCSDKFPFYHWELKCVGVRSGVDDAGRGHERKGKEVAVMAPQEQGNVVPPLSPSYFPNGP